MQSGCIFSEIAYLSRKFTETYHYQKCNPTIQIISASEKHLYQSAISFRLFRHAAPLKLCPSEKKVETVMEPTLACSSIMESYRNTICMQMIPHSALNWGVNGVLRAICHSVYLTRLSHSLTCLSCTVASVWLVFHTEVILCVR